MNFMVVQKQWRLFSADVGQAFLRGLSFKQIQEMDGEVHRDVQFTVPPGSVPILKTLTGYEDFDPIREVLAMLRAGFGLKDAPRLWQKKLQQVLEKIGCRSLCADSKLYILILHGKLALIMSSHVDDLKGGGTTEARELVLTELKKMFDGELKVQLDSFECLGVMHEQCPKTLEIWTHQQHYVKQLKPINVDAYVMADLQSEVSDQTKQSFQSLLGGVAWMTQTCIAICIYVAYLQRKGKAPTVKDVRSLNRLLNWIKKMGTKLGIRYKKLPGPIKLMVITDAAFKALEYEGLAMRGCIVVAMSRVALKTGEKFQCSVLDFYARKQTHVVRSTFAAELMAMIDAVQVGSLINLVLTELYSETTIAVTDLAKMQESGKLLLPLEVCVDAKSVYDALASDPIRIPTEKSLYIHLLAMSDLIKRGVLTKVWWIDTKDMASDALTKGSIDREVVMLLSSAGIWEFIGLPPVCFGSSRE